MSIFVCRKFSNKMKTVVHQWCSKIVHVPTCLAFHLVWHPSSLQMPSTLILHRNDGIQAKSFLPHFSLMSLWHNQKTIIDHKIDYFDCNFPSTWEVFSIFEIVPCDTSIIDVADSWKARCKILLRRCLRMFRAVKNNETHVICVNGL